MCVRAVGSNDTLHWFLLVMLWFVGAHAATSVALLRSILFRMHFGAILLHFHFVSNCHLLLFRLVCDGMDG